jgi:hypothetical protein
MVLLSTSFSCSYGDDDRDDEPKKKTVVRTAELHAPAVPDAAAPHPAGAPAPDWRPELKA